MNLPNFLTLSRTALTLLLVFLLLQPGPAAKIAALVVFTAAALTDLWDGRIARRRGLISKFGVLMDPIADKVLVLCSFAVFARLRVAPEWMVLLIVARELLITGLRMVALAKGQALPAEAAGKVKTAFQMTTISVVLLFLAARELFSGAWIPRVLSGIHFLIFLTVLLTLSSGGSFLWNNRKRIFG
jgi:CDP-diacylglycerol--glycerol-3-phosphate 3-phosphatidyltransferase